MKKRTKILLIVIWIVCLIFCFTQIKNKTNSENQNTTNIIIEEVKIEDTVQPDLVIDEQVIQEELAKQKQEKEPEITTKMYSSVGLNIREEASIESKIIDVVNVNTQLETINYSKDDEWTKIKIDDNYYYVATKYLSNEKVKIEQKKTTTTATKNAETATKTNNSTKNQSSNTGVLTKSKGVNYYNGHRETYYSQKVLPGGGLNIPGRHVDDRGLVCDGDGYICVASNDYAKGTIVETSLGTGKVYDCGCPSGTIDIYCNW